jgi:hypothetical protein
VEIRPWRPAGIPKARLRIIEQAGHNAHTERPDDVINAVRSFISQDSAVTIGAWRGAKGNRPGAAFFATRRHPGIDGVRELRTIHLGPDDLVVAAGVWVDGDLRASAVSRAIADAERRVEEISPFRTIVSMEPRVRDPDEA